VRKRGYSVADRDYLMGDRAPHASAPGSRLSEGEFVLLIDGQPPKPLKAGESYQVPIRRHSPCQAWSGQRQDFAYIVCATASSWQLQLNEFEVWA